jgi:hypothetical protein
LKEASYTFLHKPLMIIHYPIQKCPCKAEKY